MDYKKLAQTIIENVGGEANVNAVTHCATRLRFNLKDENKAKTQPIKDTKGVLGVVNKGGQYQVIIGSDVASVYKELMNISNIKEQETNDQEHKKVIEKVFDTITGIFTPILPAITAAGMIKAVLALLIAFKLIENTSQTYQVINFMGDAAFYFLPILLASSAAKKFGCNQYLAMMLGGILIHPNFVAMVNTAKEAGTGIKAFGLPITLASYSSSVIPVILIIWFMSFVEPIADKVSPKAVKFFTKPLLTALIAGIVGLVVIAPIGYIISNGIASVIKTIESHVSWLVPLLVGIFTPLLVMTGTHYGLVPIGINNRMTIGYDTVIYPGMLASNVAQGAASLAVAIKSKKSEVKQLASSAGITGICGITEPALYGINIKYKTPLYAAMIGGGFGGLFTGIFQVKNYSGGSPGLLTLPSYIGGDTMANLWYACIGAIISIIIAFIISYLLYKDKTDGEGISIETVNSELLEKRAFSNSSDIKAPINGKAVSVSQVNDPTFADEIIGKGIAIIPTDGRLVSPVDGIVTNIFETKHAIGITSDTGMELLIHVGLDTVKLGGKYFSTKIKEGDKVRVGTPLLDIDIDKIQQEGFDIITPIIVTNTVEYSDFLCVTDREVKVGDNIIKTIK